MNKRSNAILELLTERNRLEVAVIAEMLNVSQVTIRKDLDELEARGVLRREHGAAILGGPDDINNRLAYHYEEKRMIAAAAAELISDGETVMIENGSCCALAAEQIVRSRRDTTIITNSAFIAGYIRGIAGAHVILLGGDYQNSAQVNVGPLLNLCVSQFRVNKLLIGVDGYCADEGFFADDHMRVQAVRDMAARAENVVVVTESRKFDRTGVVALNLPDGVHTVVTDNALSADMEETLCGQGIRVIRAVEQTDRRDS